MWEKQLSDTPALPTAPWYVLQLRPGGLKAALVNLARQGFETLMPHIEITRRSAHGLSQIRQPLFPGYLFFSAQNREINWTSVRSTRGVSRILTHSGNTPSRLPHELVRELLSATANNGDLHDFSDLEEGDLVSIINGPMVGLTARIASLGEIDRIRLLIEIMGRSVPVNAARRDLEKLS